MQRGRKQWSHTRQSASASAGKEGRQVHGTVMQGACAHAQVSAKTASCATQGCRGNSCRGSTCCCDDHKVHVRRCPMWWWSPKTQRCRCTSLWRAHGAVV